MTPAFPSRGPDAGDGSGQAVPMFVTSDHARQVGAGLILSNPIRWGLGADPEQKHDPGGREPKRKGIDTHGPRYRSIGHEEKNWKRPNVFRHTLITGS
jgi:hypothetical protein